MIGPGVLSVLLDEHTASCPTEQLRVLFCGDAVVQSEAGPALASKQAAQVQTVATTHASPAPFVVYWCDFKRIIHILALQSFSAQIGKMRGRFGPFDSPISIALVTSRGGRESCGDALRTLRSLGVNADEAYCLAGVPRGPIKRLLRPHFLLSECFSSNWEDQTDDDLGFQKKQNKLHCVLK